MASKPEDVFYYVEPDNYFSEKTRKKYFENNNKASSEINTENGNEDEDVDEKSFGRICFGIKPYPRPSEAEFEKIRNSKDTNECEKEKAK